MIPWKFGVAVLAAVLVLGACERDEEDAAPIEQTGAVRDTLNESPLDGLSRQQIEREAQPMAPEQAERLGVIDSTIHLEDPTVNLDTVLPVNVPPPGTYEP